MFYSLSFVISMYNSNYVLVIVIYRVRIFPGGFSLVFRIKSKTLWLVFYNIYTYNTTYYITYDGTHIISTHIESTYISLTFKP